MQERTQKTTSFGQTPRLFLIFFVCHIVSSLILCHPTFGKELEDKVIKIGIIAPLYEDDEHGRSHLQGAKAKFEERKNEISKLTGFHLDLLIRDSQAKDSKGERERALGNARDLVENHKVVAILGAVNSHATMAVQKYIESLSKDNTILITSSSTNTNITKNHNNWTFRNNLSDQKLTKGVAKHIYKKDLRKVAVFYRDNAWGKGAFKDFETSFSLLGGEIPYSRGLGKQENDFKREVAEIADGGAQAICIFAGDFSKYKILKAKIENSRIAHLPVFTIGLPHRLVEAGKKFTDNLTSVTSFYDDPHSELIAHAKGILESSLDEDIPPWSRLHLNFNSARAMESMEILLQAIQNAKSTNPATIRDEIRKIKFKGLNYDISFNPKTGDLVHKTPFYLNRYGEWVDLNDPQTYLKPIGLLVGICLLAILVYLISSGILQLRARQSVFFAALPLTYLLYQSSPLISIGGTLSVASEILEMCGSIVSAIMFGIEIMARLGELKQNRTTTRQDPPNPSTPSPIDAPFIHTKLPQRENQLAA
jgi:branched-chain amino acid transport system substrate-binding protein